MEGTSRLGVYGSAVLGLSAGAATAAFAAEGLCADTIAKLKVMTNKDVRERMQILIGTLSDWDGRAGYISIDGLVYRREAGQCTWMKTCTPALLVKVAR